MFGAATLGHQHVKSSQNTLPMANDAGMYQAGKIKKPLTGFLCPLTTGGLISVGHGIRPGLAGFSCNDRPAYDAGLDLHTPACLETMRWLQCMLCRTTHHRFSEMLGATGNV